MPFKIVPVDALPEKTAIAAYELVAKALKEQSSELNITLDNVSDDGDRVGSFEISIRKTDGVSVPQPLDRDVA